MNNHIRFEPTLLKNVKLINWIEGIKVIAQFFILSGTLLFSFIATFATPLWNATVLQNCKLNSIYF